MTVYPNDNRDLQPPYGMGARNADLARIQEALARIEEVIRPPVRKETDVRANNILHFTLHTYGSRGWYDSDESYLGEAPPQDPCRIW